MLPASPRAVSHSLRSLQHSAGAELGGSRYHMVDATNDLQTLRRRKRDLRRQRYRLSKLSRYRADLVALRQAGASYRELAEWLRLTHRRRVDPTTIRRYLLQLPEMQEE